jgi:hypothetical protein
MVGMVNMRDELSLQDLIDITRAVRILKPDLSEHICIGVEQPQFGDKNVVFHMISGQEDDEKTIVMVSADYLLEHFGGTGNVAKRNV